jgi:hypothetical protein
MHSRVLINRKAPTSLSHNFCCVSELRAEHTETHLQISVTPSVADRLDNRLLLHLLSQNGEGDVRYTHDVRGAGRDAPSVCIN